MNPDPGAVDRLYDLLPAWHRRRDAAQGHPLRALLRVIGEQVAAVEDDIDQLYDDAFIETCADWAVPYIGDLVGYLPVHEAGTPGDPATAEGRLRNSFLVPRREVANTVAMRRRKGTLHVLRQLAEDVAGWPAHAREFYRLLGWTQHMRHLHLHRGRTLDLRESDALDRLGGPFETAAHRVDVRRIGSSRRVGRYDIPDVGVFAFRLASYPVSGTPACCIEQQGPHCYTFSVLGNDAPLYARAGADRDGPARECDLPWPIRRLALQRIVGRHPLQARASTDYYGEGRGFSIVAPGWPKKDAPQPIPADQVVPADLRQWSGTLPRNTVAVDPASGRLMFPVGQLPKHGVSVHYHYGFSADIGGGEYRRPLRQPSLAQMSRFQPADLASAAEQLLPALQQAAAAASDDAASACLRSRFGAASLALVDAWQAPMPVSAALADALLEEMNRLLADDGLYAPGRFGADSDLPDEARRRLAAGATGPYLARLNRLLLETRYARSIARSYARYRVGRGALPRIADALRQFADEQPRYGLVEIVDSGVYTEPLRVELLAAQSLQLRAANGARPVLRLLDYMADQPDAFAVSGHAGSRFVLDGLLVAGRGIRITVPASAQSADDDLCEVVVRHCTLVPGWSLDCDCEPKRPGEPSIESLQSHATLRIEHSIVGPIEVGADATAVDPVDIRVSDSIVDATRCGRVADRKSVV